jgi:hypothetical protein
MQKFFHAASKNLFNFSSFLLSDGNLLRTAELFCAGYMLAKRGGGERKKFAQIIDTLKNIFA